MEARIQAPSPTKENLRCCVCQTDDVVEKTAFCQKPAHAECCPAPIHLYKALRPIGLILDLDGYRVSQQPFLVREMGWCTLQGQADSVHFTHPLRYTQLSTKDKRTVNHVYYHVHGLRFQATGQEKALPQDHVETLIQTLYETYCNQDQSVVAYKGGTLERDVLNKLQLPHVDLERFYCPKADQLVSSGFDPGSSCGHHRTAQNKKLIHCPKQETYLFYQWLTEHAENVIK